MQAVLRDDIEIISLINENKAGGWEHLYDKYAPMMYGAILRVVPDQKTAEEILIQSFIQLRSNKSIFEANKNLCVRLLQHTNMIVMKILTTRKIVPPLERVNDPFSIIKSFLYNSASLTGAAEKKTIGEEDIKLKLRDEIKKYRNEVSHKGTFKRSEPTIG